MAHTICKDTTVYFWVPVWLIQISQTAATTTMNSPESLVELWKVAQDAHSSTSAVEHAELMREVGLKCITLNGVSSSILSLSPSFHQISLTPPPTQSSLFQLLELSY